MDKLLVLKKYFGYESFREGQEALIDSILEKRDTLGIMPTGAGKSMCFQTPAVMFDGITLVISPLISLMKDQVESLNQVGIRSAFLNSTLSQSQYKRALEYAKNYTYKLIYVAPERLMSPLFLDMIKTVKVSMVCIDEAHCVSQWGHDFRPSYLSIPAFINELNDNPVISAFTATATTQVKDDIIQRLQLRNPYSLTTGFDRKNLFFSVQKPKNKYIALKEYIDRNLDKCGIVYCSTRKNVDMVCEMLQSAGIKAAAYHAGLGENDRKSSQEKFIYDQVNVMIATNAFGMGIDKSNVSYVIHYNMPKNIESYYQEAGRAGRDGEPAECILFFAKGDVSTNQFLINQSSNPNATMEELEVIRMHDRELLNLMTSYCHTQNCLRQYILEYFGDISTSICDNCSNCAGDFDTEDITVYAQMILSCIKRADERYGEVIIANVLKGGRRKNILDLGLNKLSTYGLMSDVKRSKIKDIINFLIIQGYIQKTNTEYPVIKLTDTSSQILFEGKTLEMKFPSKSNQIDKSTLWYSDSSSKVKSIDPELFERLRVIRARFARKQKVPAYIIFSDASLRDMCAKMPQTKDDFLSVEGVGLQKLDKYGKEFMEAIRDA